MTVTQMQIKGTYFNVQADYCLLQTKMVTRRIQQQIYGRSTNLELPRKRYIVNDIGTFVNTVLFFSDFYGT